jgi:TRAP-type C4-dicarboxylate transport system permease small subunit
MPLRWLVLPIGLLLFLQWPLRDIVRAHSREANDLAQWLFALYVSVAVTVATSSRAHLATDALARHYPAILRHRLFSAASLLVLLPWSLFVLVAGAALTWQSIRQFEAFPDTANPLYFILKLSAWLLALLVAVQALRDARPR